MDTTRLVDDPGPAARPRHGGRPGGSGPGSRRTPTRRGFLTLALAVPGATTALTACGGSSGPGQAAAGGASMWILSGPPGESIRTAAVDSFNERTDGPAIALTAFQSDPYKAKIRTALGADQGPTIIWTWGGGGLANYVENGEVEDLTGFFAENPGLRDRILPTAFDAATVDGAVYAVPCESVAPVVLFTNNTLFAQVGARPPTTWEEVMALVPVFLEAGVAPFALAGQSRWTSMMWLEYLFDRVGGPEVFGAILAGEPGAWSRPAVTEALTMVQDLVRAGGFINGYQSISTEADADAALLSTGKAAMLVQGAWIYGALKEIAPDFVSAGELGYAAFPAVTGGAGDPDDLVGNPAGFYALSSKADEDAKAVAKAFFLDGLVTDETDRAWVGAGLVSPVVGADDVIEGSDDEAWLRFVYERASAAPNFEQSWDQALPPGFAETMLNAIEQLFSLSLTPQEFVAALDAEPRT